MSILFISSPLQHASPGRVRLPTLYARRLESQKLFPSLGVEGAFDHADVEG